MTTNKDKYGEVFTPCELVIDMFHDALMIEQNAFTKCRNIFEPGAGKGVFYETFFKLSSCHSVCYTMNDINSQHEYDLMNLIKKTRPAHKDKVIIQDLFKLDLNYVKKGSFDLILGNLPFHNGGKSFVPGLAKFNGGNSSITKPKNIVTIWPKMVHFCFDYLIKDNGYFFCIIPCIWLKEDRAGIYDLFIRKYQMIFLKVFDCVLANSLFGYNCQTPICYVMVKKCAHYSNTFKLFDSNYGGYIDFTLNDGFCIPTKHASLFTHDVSGISCYDKIRKISSLKPGVMEKKICSFHKQNRHDVGLLQNYVCEKGEYKIICGASVIKKENNLFLLHGLISRVQGLYHGIPKLILPHKRLLKCFKDYDGSYSCYGRDMYVFLFNNVSKNKIHESIDLLADYLCSEPRRTMIENGFTIRMNFIEKYVFQYIQYPEILLQ